VSNEMTLFKSGNNLPAYLKNKELDEVTKNLMGGAGSSVKRISIKGGVWRLMAGGKELAVNEDRAMNVVIVNAAPDVARTYYEGAYDPDAQKAAAPVCWSANSKTPDPSVENPQSADCANCPKNVKGSGAGGGRACRFSRRLAVVLENDLSGDVFQLTLPAQSIFGDGENGKLPLNSYVKFLAGFNVPVTAVVTEMRFDTNSATPKLTFKAVRPLTEDEYATTSARGSTPEAKAAITMTVAQANNVPKLEKKAEPAAEQEEPAPTRRESKKDVAPPKEKNLSTVLDSWDDE
jgi:hypothetical protein